MRKNYFYNFLPQAVISSFATNATAQMMGGFSNSSADWDKVVEHTIREEHEGKEVWDKLQAKQVECANLSDEEFETLGEYFRWARWREIPMPQWTPWWFKCTAKTARNGFISLWAKKALRLRHFRKALMALAVAGYPWWIWWREGGRLPLVLIKQIILWWTLDLHLSAGSAGFFYDPLVGADNLGACRAYQMAHGSVSRQWYSRKIPTWDFEGTICKRWDWQKEFEEEKRFKLNSFLQILANDIIKLWKNCF